MTARWPRLALATGLAALLAAVTWWLATPTLTGFGTAHPQPPTPSPPARAADSTASGTPSVTTSAPTPQSDVTLPGEPVRLTIPTQQVQAAVVPVQAPGGVLAVPGNIHQAGWWTSSALAGATEGTTVLDGHVDSVTAGRGALFGVQELHEGDPLRLDTATRQIRYTITGRRIIHKTGPLPAELFSATGLPRLVLISCGGPFDRASGSYRDNIVIIAVPNG